MDLCLSETVLDLCSPCRPQRAVGSEVVPLALPTPPTVRIAERVASFVQVEVELDTRLVREGAKYAEAAEVLAHDSPAEQLEVLLRATW